MGKLVDIHELQNKSKNSTITFLGHSTTLITSDLGKNIIIDPWLEGNPSYPTDYKFPEKVDYIVLTHGHSDHTASAAELAKKTGATIFATYELAMLMGKEGVDQSQLSGMNKGGSVFIGKDAKIKISLTYALHSSSFDASDGQTYYAGEACGVVVTLESGKAIYHAGDTCLFSDMKLIAEEYQPTVALLPIGDCFTMGPKEAAKAAEIIKPKIVIPIHHKTFPLLTGTAEEFCLLLDKSSTKPIPLAPGESYKI